MIYPDYNKNLIHVGLNRPDIDDCWEVAYNRMKYHEWGDNASTPESKAWRQGLTNSEEDKFRTERIGMYGEKALSLLIGIDVDREKRLKGDKWDFVIGDKKIDEKNNKMFYKEITERKGLPGPFFFKATTDDGKRYLTLKSDYYFFSYLNDFNIIDEKTTDIIVVTLCGAITKEQILKYKKERTGPPLKKDKRLKFKNYYIKEKELISPVDFLWKFKDHLDLSKIGSLTQG